MAIFSFFLDHPPISTTELDDHTIQKYECAPPNELDDLGGKPDTDRRSSGVQS
jgi:hypothetical protein